MKIKTKFCGEMEYDDENIIVFREGIPGFPDLHKYAFIPIKDMAFSYMQSTDDEKICFIVVPSAFVEPGYDIDISDETVEKLGVEKPEDVNVYSIVTIPDNINEMTVNLRAPILINVKNNKAVQEVLEDDKYSVRHKVIKEAEA
jgi:flagellar assembly factor FliW